VCLFYVCRFLVSVLSLFVLEYPNVLGTPQQSLTHLPQRAKAWRRLHHPVSAFIKPLLPLSLMTIFSAFRYNKSHNALSKNKGAAAILHSGIKQGLDIPRMTPRDLF
jgi:hypothetical protein